MSGTILVLSDDSVIAALVGVVIELGGATPVFAGQGELGTAAIERRLPLAAVFVDVDSMQVSSDLLFASATRRGIRTVIFGRRARSRDIGETAAERRVSWLVLDNDTRELPSFITDVVRRSPAPRRERRAVSRELSEPSVDGARILRDDTGRHWMVYDRRSGADRRGATDRVFVAEDGEMRHVALSIDAAGTDTAESVAAQLASAAR